MSKLSTDPYKGVRDFYPEEQKTLKWMFETIRKEVEKYGYVEYGASPLEPADLYKAKSGDEIVNEQTYTFTDRGGREVTLRPEMTPTVARMVAKKRRELGFPLRWYSMPNLFRYENPQKGRLREHYQLNVDLFGKDDIQADIEIIEIAYKIMCAFGAKDNDFEIQINDRANPLKINGIRVTPETLSPEQERKWRRLRDKKISDDERKKGIEEILGSNLQIEMEKSERLNLVIEGLKSKGISNLVFSEKIERGFDYYTGVIFEIFDKHPENRRSLFGGGRYDNLTSLFDDQNIPAVGFGMGDVTLQDFLETRNLIPPYVSETNISVGFTDESNKEVAEKITAQIREKDLNASLFGLSKQSGDFYKYAERNKIPFVLLITDTSSQYLVKESTKGGKEKVCANAEEIRDFIVSSK